jgi:CubicO group peptidase (beta-lactamase class C family)
MPLAFTPHMSPRVFGLLIVMVISSGCEVSRALRQPIPSSARNNTQDERAERIGEVIRNTMRAEGIPAISVAVIDHGEIVWKQAFGWRDIGRKLPADTDTQFQAGSISKPVTALAVATLAASGKLDLDQDVNIYFKDWHLTSRFPGKPVTLRKLLTHRAGMPLGNSLHYSERRKPSLSQILNSRDIRVVDPPGSTYRYSNGGYGVVQKVLEDVSGQPFEALMHELILGPVGMSRSHFQQHPQDTNDIARGYSWQKTILGGGRWRVFPQAQGGLWTTPRDLARLIIAMQKALSGDATSPISPKVARETLTAPFDGWQGLGFRLDGEGESRGFYHGGTTFGYYAEFGAGVSNGRGWVIMSNAQKREKFRPILDAISKEFGWNRKVQ